MILLLHKQELFQDWLLRATGEEEVTVVNSFPTALAEAKSGKYRAVLVDGEGWLGAILSLSEYLPVCAVLSKQGNRETKKAKDEGAVYFIYLNDPLDKTLSTLEYLQNRVPTEEFSVPETWHYATVVEVAGGVQLGQTQLDVLQLHMKGYTAGQIAYRLKLGPRYIEKVQAALYRKARVNGGVPGNRSVRLAKWGWENGLGGEA